MLRWNAVYALAITGAFHMTCNKMRTVAVCFIMAAVCPNRTNAAPPAASKATRPNILWISCEDMSPDMGCYGDTYACTPHLDGLARQGVRYASAFTVAGVCAPSRSAIITGMYPTSIGTLHMRCKAVPPPLSNASPSICGRRATTAATTQDRLQLRRADQPRGMSAAAMRMARPAAGQPSSRCSTDGEHAGQIRAEPEQFARRRRDSARCPSRPAQAVLPPYYPDTPIVRNTGRGTTTCHAMDIQSGDLLAQLDADGLTDNTIVFFWGDHGRGLPRAKRWIYDSGIHVPLIIRWPDHIKAGTVCEDLVSFVDLGPTVLSLAGVAVPSYMQGQAFLGAARAKPREYVFAARDRMDETYDIIRTVRDKQFQYIRNFKPGRPYAQYIDYMEKMPTMQEMRRLNKEGKLTGPQKLFFLPEKPRRS